MAELNGSLKKIFSAHRSELLSPKRETRNPKIKDTRRERIVTGERVGGVQIIHVEKAVGSPHVPQSESEGTAVIIGIKVTGVRLRVCGR